MALPFSTTGTGRQVFLLEIAGVGVFSTRNYAPSDTWFSTNNWSKVYPWLIYETIDPIVEDIDFTVGRCKVKPIRLEIADDAGQFSALIKSYRGWTHSFLVATLASDGTTVELDSATGWPASGDVNIGQERMTYSSITGTDLNIGTRALYGTNAHEHFVDTTAEIPILPE